MLMDLAASVRCAWENRRDYRHKELPRYLSRSLWASVMSKTRMEQINRYLHLADPRRQPRGAAGDYKLRGLMDKLMLAWRSHWTCGKFACVDESMIDFLGRCSFKTTIKTKHHPTGLKAYIGADGDDYYVLWIEYKTSQWDSATKGVFEGTDIAVRFMRDCGLLNTNRVLVCDNFYTSTELFSMLKQRGTFGLGVLRETRAPDGVKMANKAQVRGAFKAMHSKEHKMTVYAWQDSRVVYFLTNTGHQDNDALHKVLRWDKVLRVRAEVDCPGIVIVYNFNMNGVDVVDLNIEYCSIRGWGGRLRKWWKRPMYHLIDLTLHNARVLYRTTQRRDNPMSSLHVEIGNRLFRELVLKGFVAEYESQEKESAVIASNKLRRAGCKQVYIESMVSNGSHKARSRKTCQVCKVDRPEWCGGRTQRQARCMTACASCGPMHTMPVEGMNSSCFDLYHANKDQYDTELAKPRLSKRRRVAKPGD